MPDTTIIIREQICRLHNNGLSQQEISDITGVSLSTVCRIIQRYRNGDSIEVRRNGRAPTNRGATQRTLNLLRYRSQTYPRWTASQLQRDIPTLGSVSTRSVRRYLVSLDRLSYRPRPAPQLNHRLRQQRLLWAQEHSHWTNEDWAKVI